MPFWDMSHPHRQNITIWIALACIALMACSACTQKPIEVRENSIPEACVELLMAVHSSYAEMEGLPQPPMDFDAIERLARSEGCLEDAMGHRKYVIHYYQHLEDRDVEVVPAKFPLYWRLDSTVVQTEGTYRVEFKTQSEIEINFQCKGCARISPAGKLLASRVESMGMDFTSKTEQEHRTPDWTFSLMPRRGDLSKEVGKSYLVRIESRESYLARADERLSLSPAGPNSFKIRFRDGLEYRATEFANNLGKALALADQALIDSANVIQLKAVQAEIAEMASAPASKESAAKQDSLKREENKLKIELDAILPRILLISDGNSCGS